LNCQYCIARASRVANAIAESEDTWRKVREKTIRGDRERLNRLMTT
jgi:hypothetical protein